MKQCDPMRIVAMLSLFGLVAACSAAPRVTSDAAGSILEVSRIDPTTSSLLFVSYSRPVKTTFWIFAEDALDFRAGGAPLEEFGTKVGEETMVFVSFGPDLEEFGSINGLPISMHGGSLLVGRDDLGPIEPGDTIEFTRNGVFFAGAYRAPIPKP